MLTEEFGVERTLCGGISYGSSGRWLESYVCPGKRHNPLQNHCCDNPPKFGCCREATVFEQNKTAIVSVSLIAILILITATLAICSCWEKCILHKVIRRKPRLDYIARPEEMNRLYCVNVPIERSDRVKAYELNEAVVYRQNKDAFCFSIPILYRYQETIPAGINTGLDIEKMVDILQTPILSPPPMRNPIL
ncbi:unnamed protein product [Anisakis simplex]|uniref:Uncharacterized protein n=1 Tax=Anisakis simplex TaxID=6269 RepID=A0A0M3K0U2_ANISI|nr:unnamed protein product [Anisakis simplex]